MNWRFQAKLAVVLLQRIRRECKRVWGVLGEWESNGRKGERIASIA